MPKFERGPKKPKIDTLEDIIKLRTKDALRRVKEELKPLREQEKLACQPCKDAKAQTKMKREEIKAIKEDKSGDIAWGSKNYIARMSGNVKERLLKFESSVKQINMFNLGEMNKILDNRNMPPSLADQFRAKAADPEKGYLDGSEWKQLQAFVKEHKAEIQAYKKQQNRKQERDTEKAANKAKRDAERAANKEQLKKKK